MTAKSKLIKTLTRDELTQALAEELIADMEFLAENCGLDISEYDIDDFDDEIDKIGHEIFLKIKAKFLNE